MSRHFKSNNRGGQNTTKGTCDTELNSMISSKNYLSVDVKAIWLQLRNEPLFFWFFCGYLFFEYVRPQSAYPSLDVIPWAKSFVILAAFGSFTSRDAVPSAAPLASTFWGLTLAVLLSTVSAEFPDYAFYELNVVLNWLIIYYLFIRIVTTKFRFFIVILLIMLASYKMSQHGAISWARRGFAFERWGIAGGVGYFGNAADLGVQMLIILPLSIVLIKRCNLYWGLAKRLFFVLFPVSVLMTILATGERNTLVGLGAMSLTAALSAKRRIRNIFLLTLFFASLITVMPQALLDRFDTAGKDATSLSRMTYWKRGLTFFKNNPICGIGYNNWVPYYQKYFPGESLQRERQEVAHSTPITVLAELGIIGFIFYYGIAYRSFVINIKSIHLGRDNEERIWSNIAFALNLGTVGFLAASIFLTITYYPFLFIQASLSASLYKILLKENQSRIVTDKPIANELKLIANKMSMQARPS